MSVITLSQWGIAIAIVGTLGGILIGGLRATVRITRLFDEQLHAIQANTAAVKALAARVDQLERRRGRMGAPAT